jgi:Ca2+-binding EF-hand superfamily protein
MKTMIIPIVMAALAVPVLAQMPAGGRGPGLPTTRAEVEARIKERFARMDANRDNAVTAAEIEESRAARKDGRRNRAFAMMDTNRDGSISRSEFDAAADRRGERAEKRGKKGRDGMRPGMGRGMAGKSPAERLAMADANKDGRVTLAELSAQPLARFDAIDSNRDGTISIEERRAAREKRRAERGM